MYNQGIIFILSAPSGGGKTTLARGLLSIVPNLLLSISATTRPQRSNEINEREYFFKTKQEFLQAIEQDKFLEYAKIYDHYYGTLKDLIYEPLEKNIDILFDIDWQGAESIKKRVQNNKIVSIYILPPSLEILKQRLIFRDQDKARVVEKRLNSALEEISHAKGYDYIVINDDFNQCLEELKAIITAERIKSDSLTKLANYL